MKKIIYKLTDGKVCVITPASKESIEKVLGPLTEAEYTQHVIQKSIIDKGISAYRFIEDTDIPSSREFRDAWVDVTAESKIDICCTKAKEIKLKELREKRNKKLEDKDKEVIVALENNVSLDVIKAEKQILRDITEELKLLDTTSKVNDTQLLSKIKELSEIITVK